MTEMSPLLRIKLHAPTHMAQLVPRPHLLARLTAAGPGQLSLVAAPAGFGKTTLIGEWLRANDQAVAWLSLDRGDDEPVRFWTYVIAALQTQEASMGRSALSLLQTPPAPAIESILTTLLNELLDCPPLVLVLDDYHLITNPAIHQAVNFLLDHLPPTLHLVIISRSEPPLALARLRARRLLNEIRAADLRFTTGEATQFFTQIARLELTNAEILLLDARTEGWVTGLQLAAHSMQHHGAKTSLLEAFGGQDRYVADYLLEEVFQQQPPAVQDFLLQTAILDELCAPLCHAVMRRASAAALDNGQQVLEALERANLFVTPLDNERRWYRYQQLFRDFLLGRLQQATPEIVADLHRAAAVWYQEQELMDAAIHHALAGDDIRRAVALLKMVAADVLWQRGEGLTVLRWLAALPAEAIAAEPRLAIDSIWAHFFNGEWDAIEERLGQIEQALGVEITALMEDATVATALPIESQPMLGELAAVSAELALFQKNSADALALVDLALRLLPAGNPRLRSLIMQLKGFALRLIGDVEQATVALTASGQLARQIGALSTEIFALCDLAEVQITQGTLVAAARTLQDAMAQAGEQGAWPLPPTGAAFISMGDLLYERNELEPAAEHIQRGIALCRQGGVLGYVRRGLLLLAQVRQAQGDERRANDALDEVLAFVNQYDAPWRLLQTEAQIARVRLMQNDLHAAAGWADRYTAQPVLTHGAPAYVYQQNETVLAQIQLAQIQLAQGTFNMEFVHALIARAEQAGWIRNLIELLVNQTLALAAGDHKNRALAALERALTLAAPEGYVRTFVDAGTALAPLLRTASTQGVQPAYVGKLQAAFMPLMEESPVIADGLYESLTNREVKVLELMAAGLSNREIADELIIAIGTVAKYSNNIFTKLNVRNRTQATQRAQALKLI